jgi:6-phosphogluconolactonase
MDHRLEVLPDAEAVAGRGAELIAQAAAAVVADRGAFAAALSGGRTPWRMLELLAGLELPWDSTELFQVDERVAPPGSDERNLTHLLLALPIERHGTIRPMPVGDEDLDAAASRYAEALPEALDLIHLGLGPDGHTASLVPDDPVLEVSDRRVALTGGEYQGARRMTLTYPALAAARELLWIVTGEEKREPLAKVLASDPSIPAGRVECAGPSVIVADRAAAG